MYARSRAASRFSSAGVESGRRFRLVLDSGFAFEASLGALTLDADEFFARGGRIGGGGGTAEVPDAEGADWRSGRGSSTGIFSS